MNRVDVKINELLARSENQRLSISEIRRELEDEGELNDVEISTVCRELSDAELSGLNNQKGSILNFFSNIYLAYFLSIAFMILSAVAVFYIMEIKDLQLVGEVPTSMILWRYFLLAGSLFFLTRNLSRIIKHLRSK